MSISTPPVSVAMLCFHSVGHNSAGQTGTSDRHDCASIEPGHSLSAIRSRVTAATPSHWRDGFVSAVKGDGWIEIALLTSESTIAIWHHTSLTGVLSIGEPVALHTLYSTLAIGSERFSVLTGSALTVTAG